ncbi:hypothetical protein AAMO2058_000620700 [Amorphochlora amoebiformis]
MATIEDDPFAALNTKLLHEINKPRALVEFQLVKHLLKSRANANTKNDEGESLLILASKHGNYQVVKLLLTEIERESSFKFCMPVFERIMRVIRIITDHDEELRGDTTEDGIPAANWMKMFYCTARRQIDIDTDEREKKSDILLRAIRGKFAKPEEDPIYQERMELKELYSKLQRQSNYTFQGNAERAPLYDHMVPPEAFLCLWKARLKNRQHMIDLERINLKAHDGDTALHKAAAGGHLAVVKLLIKYGGNSGIQNRDGWTPIMSAVSGNHPHVFYYLAAGRQRGLRGYHKPVFHLACRCASLPILKYIFDGSGLDNVKDVDLAYQTYISGRPNVFRFLASTGFELKNSNRKSVYRKKLQKGDMIIVNGKLAHVILLVKSYKKGKAVVKGGISVRRVYLIRYFYPKHLDKEKGVYIDLDDCPSSWPEDCTLIRGTFQKVKRETADPINHPIDKLLRRKAEAKFKTLKNKFTAYEEVRWDIDTDCLLPQDWCDRFGSENGQKAANFDFKKAKKNDILEQSEALGLLPSLPDFTPCVNYIDFRTWRCKFHGHVSKYMTTLYTPGFSMQQLKEMSLGLTPRSVSKRNIGKPAKNPRIKLLYLHKDEEKLRPKPDVIPDEFGKPLFYHVDVVGMSNGRGWIMHPEHMVVTFNAAGDPTTKTAAPSWRCVQEECVDPEKGFIHAEYEITHPCVMLYKDFIFLEVVGKQKPVLVPSPSFRNLVVEGIIGSIRAGDICQVTGELIEKTKALKKIKEIQRVSTSRTPTTLRERRMAKEKFNEMVNKHQRTNSDDLKTVASAQLPLLHMIRTKNKGWIVGTHFAVYRSYGLKIPAEPLSHVHREVRQKHPKSSEELQKIPKSHLKEITSEKHP